MGWGCVCVCKEVIQSGGTSPLLSSHQTQSHLTEKKKLFKDRSGSESLCRLFTYKNKTGTIREMKGLGSKKGRQRGRWKTL